MMSGAVEIHLSGFDKGQVVGDGKPLTFPDISTL
jgi:hypothetical protein